ncbi:hypothetical protein P4E94_14250 [Pontiellaceae bacterium B12219]|jgi:hypothetical protein|nr:hypothetical protein [Pontiellaceae bacterium B12219]
MKKRFIFSAVLIGFGAIVFLLIAKTEIEVPEELFLAGLGSIGLGILIAGGKPLLSFIFARGSSAKGHLR